MQCCRKKEKNGYSNFHGLSKCHFGSINTCDVKSSNTRPSEAFSTELWAWLGYRAEDGILAFNPAVLGSILGVPKKFSNDLLNFALSKAIVNGTHLAQNRLLSSTKMNCKNICLAKKIFFIARKTGTGKTASSRVLDGQINRCCVRVESVDGACACVCVCERERERERLLQNSRKARPGWPCSLSLHQWDSRDLLLRTSVYLRPRTVFDLRDKLRCPC